jgi:hypothetical protein
MNVIELAKRIVINIIAVALSMTVAAVESLLPHRPDWLERVDQLATELKSKSNGGPMLEGDALGGGLDEQVDIERLLLAYNQLWEFIHDLRADGLCLDDQFCERIEREWSVTTLLTYLRNADNSLQDHATTAMDTAAMLIANSPTDR